MARRKPLVCQHLENVSGSVLAEYQDIIREYVRGRHGVYALYRRGGLYYVGLAKNLRNRLKQHLKDKHAGKWDRFSVYLTIGDSHLKELESLVLRIVRPTGNRQVGKFAKSENLKIRLGGDMRTHHRNLLDELLGRRRLSVDANRLRLRLSKNGQPSGSTRFIQRPVSLRRVWNGKLYRARLRRDGQVRYRGTLYESPSGAAAHIRGRRTNGWWFWKYERAPGDWVRLRVLKR